MCLLLLFLCLPSPFQVADGVGVGSLRRRLLAAGADNFRLEAAEAFGQSEALTTRLKHITCVSPVRLKPCCLGATAGKMPGFRQPADDDDAS